LIYPVGNSYARADRVGGSKSKFNGLGRAVQQYSSCASAVIGKLYKDNGNPYGPHARDALFDTAMLC